MTDYFCHPQLCDNTKKIRLIIADDHTLLRMGLTTLFKHQPDMTVVGQAEDGEGAVATASSS